MLKKSINTILNKADTFWRIPQSQTTELFLPFFRIGVVFIALVDFLSMYKDIRLLFSANETFIPRDFLFLYSEYFDYLNGFYNYLEANNLSVVYYQYILIIYVAALVFVLLGLFTRVSVLIALVTQLIIYRSFAEVGYGYDQFATISLFYCLIFPTNRKYSIDSMLFKQKKLSDFNYARVIQIHLCIVYFFAGIAKALDIEWWNGISLWRSVSSIYDNNFKLPPLFFLVFGIGTVLLETLYPIFVSFKKTRFITVILCIIMHLGIAFILKLYSFAFILILWNMLAWFSISKEYKTQVVNDF